MAPQQPMPQQGAPQFAHQPGLTQSGVLYPNSQEVSAPHEEPLGQLHQPAQQAEGQVSARDMLIAKAKAFREGQEIRQRHLPPEQLSMNMEPSEPPTLEDARRMAREVLSSPFSGQNLEVPAFIRKRQGAL